MTIAPYASATDVPPGEVYVATWNRTDVARAELSPQAQDALDSMTDEEWAEALASSEFPTPPATGSGASISALGSDCVYLQGALKLACLSAFISASSAPSSHCAPPPSAGFQCFRIQGDADVESLLDLPVTLIRTGTHMDKTCLGNIASVLSNVPPSGCEGCGANQGTMLYLTCGTRSYNEAHVHSVGTLCATLSADADTRWADLSIPVMESGPDC